MILEHTNPNAQIFDIEDEEDIGPATFKHISQLSQADRMVWEDIYCAKSGNLSRLEQAIYPEREDNRGIPPEVIKEEENRLANSEDVYEKAELVNFEEVEIHPRTINESGLLEFRAIYMGDISSHFLDSFPEGHPESSRINTLLETLNREDIDKDFATWFKKTQLSQVSVVVSNTFKWLVDKLVEGKYSAQVLIEHALLFIDYKWFQEYKQCAYNQLKADKVYQLLKIRERDLEIMASNGMNTWSAVKKLGRDLYINHRGEMSTFHWNIYKQLKNKYSTIEYNP